MGRKWRIFDDLDTSIPNSQALRRRTIFKFSSSLTVTSRPPRPESCRQARPVRPLLTACADLRSHARHRPRPLQTSRRKKRSWGANVDNPVDRRCAGAVTSLPTAFPDLYPPRGIAKRAGLLLALASVIPNPQALRRRSALKIDLSLRDSQFVESFGRPCFVCGGRINPRRTVLRTALATEE